MESQLPDLETLKEAQRLIFPDDIVAEELMKLEPGALWDVIAGNETMADVRERHQVRMVCAAHEQSLGDRMERTVWQAYAKRHGLNVHQRPAYMNLPQKVKPKGFG